MAASPALEQTLGEVDLEDVLVQRLPAGRNTLDPIGLFPACFRQSVAQGREWTPISKASIPRMFYEPRLGHGLPHDPFKAIIAPRPIGWISTVDAEGRTNLAPYSFFNAVHSRPPMLAFTSESMKHSAANAIETGEFVFNLCTRPLFEAMNISSGLLASGYSEFEAAGLVPAPSRLVKAPRVAASPASLECRLVHSMRLHDVDGKPLEGWLIIGQVVGVH